MHYFRSLYQSIRPIFSKRLSFLPLVLAILLTFQSVSFYSIMLIRISQSEIMSLVIRSTYFNAVLQNHSISFRQSYHAKQESSREDFPPARPRRAPVSSADNLPLGARVHKKEPRISPELFKIHYKLMAD